MWFRLRLKKWFRPLPLGREQILEFDQSIYASGEKASPAQVLM